MTDPAARASAGRWRQLRIDQRAGGGPDARQRGAEVVRHGVEQGGLERVALAGDLRLGRGAAQLVAPQGQAQLIRGKGEQPRRLAPGQRRVRRQLRPEPAERLVVGLHPDLQQRPGAGPGGRPAVGALVGPDPPGWLLARRSGKGRGERRGRQGRAGPRVGEHAGPAALLRHDPGPLQAGIRHEARHDPGTGRLEVRCRHEQAADREQRGRFGRATCGLLGPLRAERRQPADDDRHEQEQQQVEPLPRVGDDEAEPRLREDDVVHEERDDRRPERSPQPEAEPRDDDRDEVDGRCVVEPDGRALEQCDDERRGADRGCGDEDPDRELPARRAGEAGRSMSRGSARAGRRTSTA